MQKHMSLVGKMSVVVGALMVLVIGMAVGSMMAARTQAVLIERAVTKNGELALHVAEIQLAVAELRAAQRGLLLFTMMKNPAVAAKAETSYRENADTIRSKAAEVRGGMAEVQGRQAVEVIERRLAAWEPLYERIATKTRAGEFDAEMDRLVNETVTNYAPMLEATGRLSDLLQAAQSAAVREADWTRKWSQASTLALLVLCLAVCGVVAWVLRAANRKLRRVARMVGEGAQRLTAAAEQISQSSQETAQAASEQAGMIQQTSQSSSEIRDTVQTNTAHAQKAAESIKEASGQIAQAERVLGEMTESMNGIAASSGRISKIIRVIDEIAFQTNILALNAAVEAARAGEAGQGFAVVAEEVRSLAQRSAQAAQDTAALIEESIAKSKEGHGKVGGVTEAVCTMTASALRVKELVESVRAGSEEQARGIEQMAQAITRMEATTQSTAASAEQSAASATELNDQAARLEDAVIELSELVGQR